MTVFIFAGTTEGKNLAAACRNQNVELYVSVATEYGRSRIEEADNIHILCGRKDTEGIKKLLEDIGPSAVIDATHPYAAEVTRNIRAACGNTNTPLFSVAGFPSSGTSATLPIVPNPAISPLKAARNGFRLR